MTEALSGPVAIVTGASSGIGQATVERLARDGFQVAALSRSIARRGSTRGVVNVSCDVTDVHAINVAVEEVIERFGQLDALVNAAGILHSAPVGAIDPVHLRAQVEVNVLGTIFMVERCVEWLRASSGAIVNLTSTLFEHPASGMSVYGATKGAVEAYTKSVAFELAPVGVRANSLRLGLVRTPIHVAAGRSEEESEEIFEAGGARLPLGRVGTPEESAGAISYLLSSEARWITGTALVLDGGRSLG